MKAKRKGLGEADWAWGRSEAARIAIAKAKKGKCKNSPNTDSAFDYLNSAKPRIACNRYFLPGFRDELNLAISDVKEKWKVCKKEAQTDYNIAKVIVNKLCKRK